MFERVKCAFLGHLPEIISFKNNTITKMKQTVYECSRCGNVESWKEFESNMKVYSKEKGECNKLANTSKIVIKDSNYRNKK